MSDKQSGATLLISLLILIVLSIIGIAAMRGGLLQVLMATNSQQGNIAFNSAESAVGAFVTASNAGADVVGDPLYDTMIAGVGGVYTRFIDGNGALNASAATMIDSGSVSAATMSRVDARYTGQCVACPGFSTAIGGGTVATMCHVYQIDGTGTVGDTTTSVTQWATEQAICGTGG